MCPAITCEVQTWGTNSGAEEIYLCGARCHSRCRPDQFNGPPYGAAESMKHHCRFLSTHNIGEERERLKLNWNSTETSQKK